MLKLNATLAAFVACASAMDTALHGQWNWTLLEDEFAKAGYESTIKVPSGDLIAPVLDFAGPVDFGNYSINAPLLCNGEITHLQCFTWFDATFDPSRCADACESQTLYYQQNNQDLRCRFFNTYMITKNGSDYAQYCALYGENWNSTWATNPGQYDQNGTFYGVYDSQGYFNATDLGACQGSFFDQHHPAHHFPIHYRHYYAHYVSIHRKNHHLTYHHFAIHHFTIYNLSFYQLSYHQLSYHHLIFDHLIFDHLIFDHLIFGHLTFHYRYYRYYYAHSVFIHHCSVYYVSVHYLTFHYCYYRCYYAHSVSIHHFSVHYLTFNYLTFYYRYYRYYYAHSVSIHHFSVHYVSVHYLTFHYLTFYYRYYRYYYAHSVSIHHYSVYHSNDNSNYHLKLQNNLTIFSYGQLYQVNVSTGTSTLIKNNVGGGLFQVNAMGYNSLDNYLYAALFTTPVLLIKINSTGDSSAVEPLPVFSTVNAPYAGDVDEVGYYWAYSYVNSQYVKIDVTSGAGYGSVVAAGIAIPDLLINVNIPDFAYVPGGGNFLYGLGYNTLPTLFTPVTSRLYKFDRTLLRWSLVTDFGHLTGGDRWGAVYAAPGGILYATENVSGEIWKFTYPFTDKTGANRPVKVSTGLSADFNDGARCINAA
ncbi:Uu.00g103410.m01.CDS01 [Anthostomella pinea]|uniref:Uu.00g103410.m01.CDS01 n=1 Tax=Anthostomella pinea TaxID=933095 RepID=A0AAI8VEI4_9PEZI|nr:Uu.00g103410.m01.CDS01 [Anthostomella pinea]